MPIALLIRPSSLSPASVTPKWSGTAKPSASSRAANRRTACVITMRLELFIDTTTSVKRAFLQIRRYSSALSTIPSGVLPYRSTILRDREP